MEKHAARRLPDGDQLGLAKDPSYAPTVQMGQSEKDWAPRPQSRSRFNNGGNAMPVIGFLGGQSPQGYSERLRGFRQGLKERAPAAPGGSASGKSLRAIE